MKGQLVERAIGSARLIGSRNAMISTHAIRGLRCRSGEQGEHSSWQTLRNILGGQQRVTCSFRRDDGSTLHVCKATRAEPDQGAIYDALGVDPQPGGVKKLVVA